MKKINLKTERMKGNGPGKASIKGMGFQPNYLYGLNDLCEKFLDKNSKVLEIGCNRGVSTSLFCFFAKKVIAVDPKLNNELKKVIKKWNNLSFYKERGEHYMLRSKKKFDLIYLDALHDYTSVKKDIKLSLKLLKKNGVLAGHDMNDYTPGVLKAVNKLFPEIRYGTKIIHRFSDSSWAIQI